MSVTRCCWVLVPIVLLGGSCARQAPNAPPQPVVIKRAEGLPPIASAPEALLQAAGIRRVQQRLRERGYDIAVNGEYGRETELAVYAFQRSEGLAATGMPDFQTLRRLGLDAKQLYGGL